jgi:hypothetical protein
MLAAVATTMQYAACQADDCATVKLATDTLRATWTARLAGGAGADWHLPLVKVNDGAHNAHEVESAHTRQSDKHAWHAEVGDALQVPVGQAQAPPETCMEDAVHV